MCNKKADKNFTFSSHAREMLTPCFSILLQGRSTRPRQMSFPGAFCMFVMKCII